jgi:dimethylhistidine N-methyltransferase
MHLRGGPLNALATAVREGLTARPKRLPPWLFYDARGSKLFERITRLPEYYPTRTEHALLQAQAETVLEAAGPVATLVELGSGSSLKTRILLEALLRRNPGLCYAPIDVSGTALARARWELARRFPTLKVEPLEGTYEEALPLLAGHRPRRLILFLGSSLGNFDLPQAVAMLGRVRAPLGPGDGLLLGLDLVKAPELLLPAYDDAQGVTAAFNLNLLRRLNRDLGADFRLDGFCHRALWNAGCSRVEMHLESLRGQEVGIPALGLRVGFQAGERVHTENSYKFRVEGIRGLLGAAGWGVRGQWVDEKGWFSLNLAGN